MIAILLWGCKPTVVPPRSPDPPPGPRWFGEPDGRIGFKMATVDFNGDGDDEAVLAPWGEGDTFLLNAVGSGDIARLAWRRMDYGSSKIGGPRLAGMGDLDGDGFEDLLRRSAIFPGSEDPPNPIPFDVGTMAVGSKGHTECDANGDGQADLCRRSITLGPLHVYPPFDYGFVRPDYYAELIKPVGLNLSGNPMSVPFAYNEGPILEGIDIVPLLEPSQELYEAGQVAVHTFTIDADGRAYFDAPSAVGDLDGDGSSDLVIATGNRRTFRSEGVYVLTDTSVTAVQDATIRFLPTETDRTLGSPFIGDFDGDGQADLALAAPPEVRIYRGPLEARAYTREDADVIYIGDPSSAEFPTALAVGDIDGDGRDDLLIGDSEDTARGTRAGKVYFVSGAGL